MTMLSYAQNGEDVLLKRVFSGQATGFYIDVGANDPVECSVTKYFYDRGWRGINCEPSAVFDRLSKARPRDINLNLALAERDEMRALHEFPDNPGFSTFDGGLASQYRRLGLPERIRLVPTRTLRSVCEEYVQGPIDFLSVDVEGAEREVLAGGDWQRYRPRVVLVECNHPQQWEPILLAADYIFTLFDGINRWYVRGEDRPLVPLLSIPVNVLDDWVPSRCVQQIERLERLLHQLDEEELRRTTFALGLRFGRLLHRLAVRYPRTAAAVKRSLRLAG